MTVPDPARMLAEVEGEEITVVFEERHTAGGPHGAAFGSGDEAAPADGGQATDGGAGSGTPPVDAAVEGPPPEGERREVEDGEDVGPDGRVISRYHIERMIYADRSVTYQRTDRMTDGGKAEATGVIDAAGNESYTLRVDKADGTSTLTTRTSDADRHGTEHTTWFDAAGNQTDDQTFTF